MRQGWLPFSLAPQFRNQKGPHSELGSLRAGGGLWQEGSAAGGAACPLGPLSAV